MNKIYVHILAASPNFIKAAHVIEELSNKGFKYVTHKFLQEKE